MTYSKSFEKCIRVLSKLPGIGRKTALRLLMHLLKMSVKDVEEIAGALLELKRNTKFCAKCGSLADEEYCQICVDENRDKTTVCVVEEAKDVFLFESGGRYRGVYHVLGGRLAPLDGITPDDLRINGLLERIKHDGVKEVILATNPDVEGDTTAIYLSKLISKHYNIKVTRIATGIPIGGYIEYADEITILKSLENRREMY
ncbi:MAG: recombination mediator RecR [Calditerrivibrio sp.]|nr:recombination mediator RecR [Calditerrivibrio sp.]